ncbi:MAG TPA: general secretion pathway protein GspK [Candidatus Paceibacterota bacterium]|nr:general secretion pathway protein GspK [Verrucomicrobiota bacterium]HOX02712.1 general secretion pathway protein GspK [Verrucomicrobiota bacterium]HRZ45404.1 general secretion pathway protein GspK [Candidatus Paceibacterota bacterium]
MKIPAEPRLESGIALVMVMAVIFVLAALAGGMAYSMKIEIRLAQNHQSEAELEWLGRSGIELARYILAQEMMTPAQPYDALNQKWAGGSACTNENLMDISLEDNRLGRGTFSIKIVDQERKFNINTSDQILLQQALNQMGVDAAESSAIVDCLMDWRDGDDHPLLSGAESEYYLSLEPPYYAKNGPIDDIHELLLVRGISREIFFGPGRADRSILASDAPSTYIDETGQVRIQAGLIDLFTPISGRLVNINTASAAVLQFIPGIDPVIAQGIIRLRAGPDGVEGNEDDTPFRNPGELINVPGMGPQMVAQMARYFTVRSGTFEVQVEARIGSYRRLYTGLLRRNNPRDIQLLYFTWD